MNDVSDLRSSGRRHQDDRHGRVSIPSTGGASRVLTHEAANLLHPRVSPDGRWIAATRMAVSKEIWRLGLKQ